MQCVRAGILGMCWQSKAVHGDCVRAKCKNGAQSLHRLYLFCVFFRLHFHFVFFPEKRMQLMTRGRNMVLQHGNAHRHDVLK